MAVTVRSPRRLTADEFFALPGEQTHMQLIDGEIVINAPSTRHQMIVGWLHARLLFFAEANPGLGGPGLELDSPIDDDNVYAQDCVVGLAGAGTRPAALRGPARPGRRGAVAEHVAACAACKQCLDEITGDLVGLLSSDMEKRIN